MKTATKAWIGMGSNQGDRMAVLQSALDRLQENGLRILRVSHTYETEPVGFESDTRFLNAVAEAEWSETAASLLKVLLETEAALGRTRNASERYSSRTIDLDILLFGEEVINIPELFIPHPRMAERRFVLEPLNELIPSYIHPVLQLRIDRLLEGCVDGNQPFIRHKRLYINH
jgi:2-amino-4-hydroxy-6-hydroxymethyldihydropteridine diphosphokinase